MKRSYLHKSKVQGKRRARLVALIAVLFLAVLALNFLVPSFLPNVIYRAATPLYYVRTWAQDTALALYGFVSNKSDLIAENELLKSELAVSNEKLLKVRILEEELSILTQSRTTKKEERMVAVLSRPPTSPYDTIVVASGTENGTALGDRVLSQGGSVIGEVTEVFRNFSRATLFSSPAREVVVEIGTSRIQARARGVGGGAFEALLPREIELAKGEAVVMAGAPSYLLGVIESIENREADYLQLVRFRSPVNVYELHYVTLGHSSLSGDVLNQGNGNTTTR